MSLLDRITDEDNLYQAWRRVRANGGGPGVDAVRLADFEESLPANLHDLARRLRDETYLPLPLRKASLPKKDGGERALAIPAVADRVAQRAFVNVLDPVFETVFLPCSFGYRTGRGVADAVEAVLGYRAAGLDWIVDADVQEFFPSVDHALLLDRLREYVDDRAVLRTIGLWLEAGALTATAEPRPTLLTLAADRARSATRELLHGEMDGAVSHFGDDDEAASSDTLPLSDTTARQRHADLLRRFGTEAARLAWDYQRALLPLLVTKGALLGGGVGVAAVGAFAVGAHLWERRQSAKPRQTGTPQGGPISPLLANVYLHDFDVRLTRAGLRLVRYADDFVVCCPSEARARHARQVAEQELARLRLRLHPNKTRIVACADPLRFLGHEFDADGAFPVPDPAPTLPALPPAVRESAGRVAQSASEAARKTGALVRKGGAALARDFGERWDEVREQRNKQQHRKKE